VAIAVVLLCGAGLTIRSFQKLANVNPGFDPSQVLIARIQLPRWAPFDENAFFGTLLDRLKALPGVESAGLISYLPLSGQNNDTWFTIEGRAPVASSERPYADIRTVSADYFQTMGIPLMTGRYFTANDNMQSAKVAIVSRSLAEKYFPNRNPLGQHLNIDLGLPFQCEIVGG
jgi:putative ABC transport system permease protein